MTSYFEDVLRDIGPLWCGAGLVLILLSLTLRTWTILAFIGGCLITLYTHPYGKATRQSTYRSAVRDDVNGEIDDKDAHFTLPPELATFSKLLIANYIDWWYCAPNFIPDSQFPAACRRALDRALAKLCSSFSRKDPVFYFDTICTKSVATLGAVLADLRGAQRLKNPSDPVGLQAYVMTNPDSFLARVLDRADRRHDLTRCADQILNAYADPVDLKCVPVLCFMRQLLAFTIIDASVVSFAQKDSLNLFIITSLTESKTTVQTQFSAVLSSAAAEITQEMNTSVIVDAEEEPSPSPSPPRGRRLSFKTKSISSINDIRPDMDTPKKPSFLKRTGSLLSRSRSRSPSKRAQEIESELKAIEDETLLGAEFCVLDASERAGDDDNVAYHFTVMVTPPTRGTTTSGFCVIRTVTELEDLDASLRAEREMSSMAEPASWLRATSGEVALKTEAYLNTISKRQELADHAAFKEFCRSPKVSENIAHPASAPRKSASDSRNLYSSLRKGTELLTRSAPTTSEDPRKKQAEQPAKINGTVEVNGLPWRKSHSRASSRSISPLRRARPSASVSTLPDIDSLKPRAVLSQIEFQNLVDQVMELLSSFFDLSSKTWTIRKQLLNLLRNLLLSKNSNYATTFKAWLEDGILNPLSDPHEIAIMLQQFNAFMFPAEFVAPVPLTPEESELRAKQARTIFVQKAMPSAIKNLMGTDCVEECLGVVFDALQQHDFSAGLLALFATQTLSLLMVE